LKIFDNKSFKILLNISNTGDMDKKEIERKIRDAMEIARKLEKEIEPRFEFDVKLLDYSPVEFQHEVLKKGRVIFKRDENRRIEYEASLISTYLDLNYMYKFIDKEFLVRF
jgi:predicted nucleotidyltransferase